MSTTLRNRRAIESRETPAAVFASAADGRRAAGTRLRPQPAPALKATAALHLGGALALALAPESWPWVAGTLIANHAVLLAGSVAPRSQLLGPNLVRLPPAAEGRGEVSLTFDDGPDPEVTPRVLDLLDACGAKASFFCIGERATASPDLTREIVARGHSVESHSQRHSAAFACYGPWRLMRELSTAQRALAEASGSAPTFFRAPFGTRNPMLDPTLRYLGLAHVSWTRRGFDRVDRNAPRVLRRLLKGLAAGDVLLLHDSATGRERADDATVLSVLPPLLEAIKARDLRAVSLRTACSQELGT